jgi:tetratricopeptide (TPR) repeat protein
MRKAFGLLLIIILSLFENFVCTPLEVYACKLSLFKNFVCTPSEVDACKNFYKAGDYRRAVEAGKIAVKKYPNNPYAHICLSRSYYKIGELKLALEHMKRAESLSSDKKDLMYIYTWIGMIYGEMGYLDDAFSYYSRSLSLVRDLGNKNMLDKALCYYEESLRLRTDEKAKAIIYNNIALFYKDKGDYQNVAEYFQKLIEIYERYGNYHGASRTKLNLGNTYREMRDYKKAEKYILEGLEGVRKVGDKYWEATGYEFLGRLYIDKGDKKTAKDYLTRAYNLYKSIDAELEARIVLSEIRKLER